MIGRRVVEKCRENFQMVEVTVYGQTIRLVPRVIRLRRYTMTISKKNQSQAVELQM